MTAIHTVKFHGVTFILSLQGLWIGDGASLQVVTLVPIHIAAGGVAIVLPACSNDVPAKH
jgi:hypothetical protein